LALLGMVLLIGKLLKRKKNLYLILIVVFFLIIFLNNLDWLARDKSVPSHAQEYHLIESGKYYRFLREGNIKYFLFGSMEDPAPYPPLSYQITSIFFMLFGYNQDVASISQAIFWFILIFSTFYIGSYLWGEEAGLLAGIASFSFSFVIYISHRYGLDLPSAAMVSLSLLCLLRSEKFEKPKWTLGFFIAFAISMLIKWSSAFFILIPFLYYFGHFLWKAYKEKKSFRQTILLLLLISTGVIALLNNFAFRFRGMIGESLFLPKIMEFAKGITILFFVLIFVSFIPFENINRKRFFQGFILFFILIWYFYGTNPLRLIKYFLEVNRHGGMEGDIHRPFMFPEMFLMNFMHIPRVIMLLTGIIFYLVQQEKTIEKTLFLLSFIGSTAFLYLFPDKEDRYLLPLIPFIAVLMTYWMSYIKWKLLKIPIITFFLIISFLGIMGWRLPFLEWKKGNVAMSSDMIAQPPATEDWRIREIGRLPNKYSKNGDLLIFVLANSPGNILRDPYSTMPILKLMEKYYPFRPTFLDIHLQIFLGGSQDNMNFI